MIGERLGHSFSKEIHEAIADYEYELCELSPDTVEGFIKAREFSAINVTIPYKEVVIPYLDEIDEAARTIGAVNCIVNQDGKLHGYNTDFYGMSALISYMGLKVSGACVAVLGTGGTSKTARAVMRSLGCERLLTVSRTPKEDEIGYDELYQRCDEVDIIVNTTPVGMYPKNDATPVDLARFKRLVGVVDAIYNPLSTRLVSEARAMGVNAMGGLYMLVAQAVRAIEIFKGKPLGESVLLRQYERILKAKENVVLIGMPSSGKTTVGAIIADRLGRKLVDTDKLIVENAKMEIPEIFQKYGEAEFRRLEGEAVREAAAMSGVVIATGGGAILKPENVNALKMNGKLYFIDRPLDLLMPTEDRPLSRDREQIQKRYEERYPIYTSVCDYHVDGSGTPCEVAERIIGE